MIISKIAGAAAVAGALAAAILYGLWQGEKAKVATLEANNQTLTNAVAAQQVTIDTMVTGAEKQRESQNVLNHQIRAAETSALVARAEIDGLRSTIRTDLRNASGPVADMLDRHLNDGLQSITAAFGSGDRPDPDPDLPPADAIIARDPRDKNPPGHNGTR